MVIGWLLTVLVVGLAGVSVVTGAVELAVSWLASFTGVDGEVELLSAEGAVLVAVSEVGWQADSAILVKNIMVDSLKVDKVNGISDP